MSKKRVQAMIPADHYRWIQDRVQEHEGLNASVILADALNQYIPTFGEDADHLGELAKNYDSKRKAQRRAWNQGPNRPLTTA